MSVGVYRIGDINIAIRKPDHMMMPLNMQKFTVSGSDSMDIERNYHLEFTNGILQIEDNLWSKKVPGKEAVRETLRVFQTSDGECRVVYLAGEDLPYAVSLTAETGLCQIWIDEQYNQWLKLDTVFAAMFSLEKLMIDRGAMILHSAYVCYKDTAILFSAPSKTGKSTQASLWEKCRQTRTINGDRTLLMRDEEGWKAYGWPVCGSSAICHNESYPIRAIVMLKQARENRISPLKGLRALREVLEQITVNGWDSEFQMCALDCIEVLLNEVPVYLLECDISEDAVECLETVLK